MDEERLDDTGLAALVDEMDGADLNRVLSLLSFKTGGSVPVRRRSLLSFLHGPKSRRRRNWLAAALRVGLELELGVDYIFILIHLSLTGSESIIVCSDIAIL
eukprot:SAG11_NODE_884_length_6733_cov_3.462617_7_plen_102_part_00